MNLNLYAALKKTADKFPRRTALLCGREKITFSGIIASSSRFAAALESEGIRKGDHVALLLRNSPEFVYASMACFRLGAAAVPLNYFLTTNELVYILNDSRALALVSSSEFSAHFSAMREEANNLRSIINVDMHEFTRTPASECDVDENDLAAILYTSGTTGHPKGAMLTHGNFLSNVESCGGVIPITRRDRALCFLPLFHSFSLTVCLLLPLFNGASVLIMPHLIKGPRFLRLIFIKRVTLFVSIPQVYSLFAGIGKLIGRLAFSRVRYFVSGADTLPDSIITAFEKKFGRKILEGYGLTEAAPVVTFNPPGKTKPGSVGKPLPGVRVSIRAPAGEELADGETGEIAVKGGNVMRGYFGYPEATALALKDGWLYTGDMGFRDGDGYITIAGRKKDMFVCRGLNVYPKEIENVLNDFPGIEEAAVVGCELKEDTFVPVAYVKTTDGDALQSRIQAFCRRRLAGYKVPRRIIFVEDFPRTATGKISKKDLPTSFSS